MIVSHRSSSDPDQPFVLPPFCPWPEALGMWSPNSPLAVATSAAFLGSPFPPSRWETGSSAPHILVVSEDKHQGSSPVNANVLRLIIFIRKHTKDNKSNSIWGLYSVDKILTTGFLGLQFLNPEPTRDFYLGSCWVFAFVFWEITLTGSLFLTKRGNQGRKTVVLLLLFKGDSLHLYFLPYRIVHVSVDLLFAGFFLACNSVSLNTVGFFFLHNVHFACVCAFVPHQQNDKNKLTKLVY